MVAFVEYVGDDAMVLSRTFAGWHVRAHFREDTCWYCADDSVVKVVAAESQFPKAYPYICFLEHSESDAMPPWPPHACYVDGLSDSDASEPELDNPPNSSQAATGASSSGFWMREGGVKRRVWYASKWLRPITCSAQLKQERPATRSSEIELAGSKPDPVGSKTELPKSKIELT